MPLAYFSSSGTASAAGIFIPRDNIAGLIADSELASSEETITKDCKFLTGFLTTLQGVIAANRSITGSLATALGFTITKGNPTGVQSDIFTQTFTTSVAQVVDYSTGTFYPIPVPTSGSNSGRGVLKITDVFPDAVSVASAASIAEAGVLIPHTEVDAYGAVTATNPTSDTQSRQWFAAMLRYLFNEIPIRVTANTDNFSALITKTLGTVSPFTLPNDALSFINPSTGLDPTKTSINDVYFRSLSFTIEYLLNEQFQRFEVRTSFNSTFNIVNITRPSVIEFLDVPASSINSVESIKVRFSEVIDLSTFNFNDISLTRDNSNNLVNSSVTIEYLSGTTYQIKGLSNLTLTSGVYQLTVDTNGIKNLTGNTGSTTAQATFSIIPVITLVSNLPPITTSNYEPSITLNQWVSSSFKTGSAGYGYTLDSVTLLFRQITSSPNLFVHLYSDNFGSINSLISSFTNPSSITTNPANNIFTLNTPQTLTANTTYWLVAGISSGSGEYRWRSTINGNQTESSAWSIGDNSFFSDNQGGIWSSFADFKAFQFSVQGA